MSSRGYNLRRPGERTNHHLDRDFVWPHHFGVDNTPNDISNQITCVSEPCIQTSENISSQGQIVTNEVQNPENLHGIETISQKSRYSRHSTTSSIRSRRRELALNMEKAKQEIEMKKLELDNQLKLLQIEHEFHEQEINETRECESIKSTRSLYPTVRVLTPISKPPSSPKTTDIQNWVNEIEIQPTQDQEQPRKEDPPTVPREMTDIQLLCKTLSETFQKATSRPEDNFRMYRLMEKDFPIFDGNPAEWPMFISQVHLVSSMCKFSNAKMSPRRS
ncbi:hypothetical protein JTB14_000346 [Gonioctena quinquepunctata]|nr:hypothetical protein JTB14_000346 [Gonioctena quinquepunctata]